MIDEWDKNKTSKIFIGHYEFRVLIKFLNFPYCTVHQMKLIGNMITKKINEGKYFFVDKILKDNMILNENR